MIDINELRSFAKTAHYGHLPLEVSGSEMLELLDRLEAAESEAIEQARLNGMGSEREAALMAKLEAAEKNNNDWLYANAPGGWIDNLRIENEALRAKIAEMKQQEPVAIQHRVPSVNFRGECVGYSEWQEGKGLEHWPSRTLYALPGAQTQGEEK